MSKNHKASLASRLMYMAKTLLSEDEHTKPSALEQGPDWLKYVAVLTGVLAAVTGILAVRSTRLTNDAIYESSLAVLAQAQASDAWAEYQADSIKARILEAQDITSPRIAPSTRTTLQKDIIELRGRQPELKKAAQDKTAERDSHLTDGRSRLAEKDILEYASLAAQAGIALASIAAITKRHQVFGLGILAGLTSIGLLAYALMQHYFQAFL